MRLTGSATGVRAASGGIRHSGPYVRGRPCEGVPVRPVSNLPDGAILLSPWVDLSASDASVEETAARIAGSPASTSLDERATTRAARIRAHPTDVAPAAKALYVGLDGATMRRAEGRRAQEMVSPGEP